MAITVLHLLMDRTFPFFSFFALRYAEDLAEMLRDAPFGATLPNFLLSLCPISAGTISLNMCCLHAERYRG